MAKLDNSKSTAGWFQNIDQWSSNALMMTCGRMEMATVMSALVRLCKMRCMFFFTVKTVLTERSIRSSFPLSAGSFLWRPLIFCMPWLVRLSLTSFLYGTTKSAISSRTLWTIFWLAKT